MCVHYALAWIDDLDGVGGGGVAKVTSVTSCQIWRAGRVSGV